MKKPDIISDSLWNLGMEESNFQVRFDLTRKKEIYTVETKLLKNTIRNQKHGERLIFSQPWLPLPQIIF